MAATLRTALVAGLVIGFVAGACLLATSFAREEMSGFSEDQHEHLATGPSSWEILLNPDVVAGLASGIVLSNALPALPCDAASTLPCDGAQAENGKEDVELSWRFRLAAAYAKVLMEARGYESDIRITLFVGCIIAAFRSLSAGLSAVLAAVVATLVGLVAAAGHGGMGTTFLLGLLIPLSFFAGVLHMFLLGMALGGIAVARFWIRFLEEKLLYHPRSYSGSVSWGECFDFGGSVYSLQKVSYSIKSVFSAELQQTAMLVKPEARSAGSLWVVCGGNSMLGTDWLPHFDRMLRLAPPPCGVAFLLIDYPGYGWNDGRPSPSSALAAARAAVDKALSLLSEQPKVNLIGHSLGSAAVAQLAHDLSRDRRVAPGRLILSAPFLDIPTMGMCILGGLSPPTLRPLFPPLFRLFVPHRWDNTVEVPKAAQAGWHLTILHGALDELVPCYMGRELFMSATRAIFVGQVVEAHSLTTMALNDRRGRVTGIQGDRLQISFGSGQETKALRQRNVRIVGSAAPAQASSASSHADPGSEPTTRTEFLEVPGAGHNDVFVAAKDTFAELLRAGNGIDALHDAI